MVINSGFYGVAFHYSGWAVREWKSPGFVCPVESSRSETPVFL